MKPLNENYRLAKANFNSLLVQGLNYSQIAKELYSNGFKPIRGRSFQAVQVQRLSKVK